MPGTRQPRGVARPLRDRDPGLFHVTVNAIDPGAYFLDGVDKMIWRATLARTIVRVRAEWTIVAHCEMTTHAHLIVAAADTSLSTGMQLLGGEYTRAFNRRHGRHGPLQRRRFGAVRIETDAHLANAFRYVARNPVEAGACRSPLDWPDSSYRAALGLEDDGGLTDASAVLRHFDPDRTRARTELRLFVELPTAARAA